MIPNFWLLVIALMAVIFIVALLVLEWLARREARAHDLRDEARRHAHLYAITRGKDPRR